MIIRHYHTAKTGNAWQSYTSLGLYGSPTTPSDGVMGLKEFWSSGRWQGLVIMLYTYLFQDNIRAYHAIYHRITDLPLLQNVPTRISSYVTLQARTFPTSHCFPCSLQNCFVAHGRNSPPHHFASITYHHQDVFLMHFLLSFVLPALAGKSGSFQASLLTSF